MCARFFKLQWCYELHVFFSLLIIWRPVHWSSTDLTLTVFFNFHVNGRSCCVIFALSAREDNRLSLTNPWLNSTVPSIHAVFKLNLCNRRMRSVTYLEVEWLPWAVVGCHCCMHLIFWLHDGLVSDSWLVSLCRCPLARCMQQEFISTFRSAPSNCCHWIFTWPELVFAISPKRRSGLI